MIQSKEMKSRSKVTKRQKVLLTSEMAFLFSGEKKPYGEKAWLWDSEVLMEAMAGRLRSRSCCSSGGLLILGPSSSGPTAAGAASARPGCHLRGGDRRGQEGVSWLDPC